MDEVPGALTKAQMIEALDEGSQIYAVEIASGIDYEGNKGKSDISTLKRVVPLFYNVSKEFHPELNFFRNYFHAYAYLKKLQRTNPYKVDIDRGPVMYPVMYPMVKY